MADPAEDRVDAVFVSGDPPEQRAAGSAHGGAVLRLLRELGTRLLELTLGEGGGGGETPVRPLPYQSEGLC